MSDLISGRTTPCKDNLGGIDKIYLMDYIYYGINLLGGYKSMTLSSFPVTKIFEYKSNNISVSENGIEGISQRISFFMPKQDLPTTQLISLLSNKRLRAITIDYKGRAKIYGLKNGLDCDVNITSGASKQDRNGYEIKLDGLEQYASHFISDLQSTGFFEDGIDFGCILASSANTSSGLGLISSCNSITNQVFTDSILTSSSVLASTSELTSL